MAPTPKNLPPWEERNTEEFGRKVVISGISGLYPKSHSVKDLSNILYNKVNPIAKESPRWKYDHPEVAQYTGEVPALKQFDAQFFKVHFSLGHKMDPMSRKMLEQTYQAIYDAGICLEELSGKKIGVYIGSCNCESEKALIYGTRSRTGMGIPGSSKSMFANRISYWLNVKGPSMNIAEACCSSIQALEQAYHAINQGECEAAIVGGANICLHPQTSIHFGRIIKTSNDGTTKSFDTDAAGCVMSEAINCLFLQKAKDALRIYAEVVHVKCRFTSILQDEIKSPKFGFYRDPEDIANFLSNFYEETQIPPRAVEYVEAFGSATPEADKAELEAIEKVFCNNRRDPLLVGSVMSNIGYGEAASGISAITKVILGYHSGQLAGNLNCDSPRKDIPALRDGRMRILTDHQTFGRSYTAINGLSVSGVNAHVLLHSHYKSKDLLRYKTNIPHLVFLSGRQESSVIKILQDLKSRPVDPEEIALLHNIHKSRISGHLGRGFILLDTNEKNETITLREKVDYFDDAKRPLWFVYSGMGSQWAGMGAQFMKIPIFAAAIEKCRRVLEPKGVDIVHIITSRDKNIFDNILNSFVGIASIQIGLTDVLRALKIVPDKIIGHSVGELGCAYADGCFTAEEMILSAYSRGLVSVQTSFIRGSMAAVGVGYKQISKMCPPEIEVACHNGPDSSTISGPADIMKEFVAQLTEKKIFAKEVPCSNIAFHSKYIAGAGPGLLKYLGEVITSPKLRSERWVSTSVPQEKWNDPIAKYSSAEYHTNNLLSSVLFEETSKLIPENAVVIEIAPHGLLQAILKRSLPESCKHVPLARRGHPDNAQFLLEAIGNLYMMGYNPQVQTLYPKVEFPVSTETPMLSHLIEWSHTELWSVPYYMPANRNTAASCTHILSIHDDDHQYLTGHVIRETNLYPFAATLVAVWDTLAMVLGVPKRQRSVQFRDVRLYAQPILHDQRQLRLNVNVQRGRGYFEVLDDGNIKVSTGFISSEIDNEILFKEELKFEKVLALKSEDIYKLLSARNYNYSNGFRSIHNANISLTKAHLLWQNNWVTLLDGMIQLNVLKRPHKSISQPNYIKRIVIDVEKHSSNQTLVVDDANVYAAEVYEMIESTRCGGIIIENIKFHNLPSINKEDIALKTLKFVPHVSTNNIDENSALYVFLQIVAENLNKHVINVGYIVDYKDQAIYEKIHEIIQDIPEIKINLIQICRYDLTKQPDGFFENIDVLITANLAADKDLCQVLHEVLNRDTFLINKEDCTDSTTIRPSALYRSICAHTFGSSRLELVLWRPSDDGVDTSVVTVFSQADFIKLSTQLSTLPPKQRLVISTSHPAFDGLKDMVKEWRNKNNCKINLVIINNKLFDDQCLNQTPFIDLAINTLDHDIWGGEYYLPVQGNIGKDKEIALDVTRLSDVDSVQWIEVTESSHPGIPVKVHYAGLNAAYVKKVLGVAAKENMDGKKLIEYDFSGITDSNERVMGIVRDELITNRIKAKPELLWPVPEHWTLEDAATVPLAYCLAFYCLCFKSKLYRGNSILVHGGAGALGQAIISIALSYDCDIYTTVSDVKKKRFLLRLFPELKEDHIGYSRDSSFKDMVLNGTNGMGCDVVINSVKGNLRNASIGCCKQFGSIVDTSFLLDNEDYSFEMFCLFKALTYSLASYTQQFSSLFEPKNIEGLRALQLMMSEGIARGYVRPLSRVVYAAGDAPRAMRLQAGSRHLGRVLLHLEEDISYTQLRINCSSDRLHLLFSDNDVLGMQLADRLISRGTRKLVLHCSDKSNSLMFKLRSWEKQGVQCAVSYGNTWNENILNNILNNTPEKVEGIYCIISSNTQSETHTKYLEDLNSAVRRSNWPIKYFAVIDARNEFRDMVNLKKRHDQFMTIKLAPLKIFENVESKDYFNRINSAVDAIEKALCYKQRVIIAHPKRKTNSNLLQELASLADLSISRGTSQEVTLKDMGMDLSKSQIIRAYLRDVHCILLDESFIPLLTVKKILELEDKSSINVFSEAEDLKTFFSYIDPDELTASMEMIFLPTLTTSSVLRDVEFDVNRSYLCIVPGVEGLHLRFHVLCERLKLPALVLQPGTDRPNETIQEMAQRYAEILLKKNQLKKRFYLLGYESGVLVALEMAAILEEHGLTGKIFCIGGAPDEVLEKFEKQLVKFPSDQSLQVAVACHMLELLNKDVAPEDLKRELTKYSTWNEKVSFCVQKLLGRIDHSIQYAKVLIESAYARIVQVRSYNPAPRPPLRSLLISIRPCLSNQLKSPSLQSYSQHKVVEYDLQVPLAYAAQDLRCAAIVNRNLDDDILEEFDRKNLCETYLSSESFETNVDSLEK